MRRVIGSWVGAAAMLGACGSSDSPSAAPDAMPASCGVSLLEPGAAWRELPFGGAEALAVSDLDDDGDNDIVAVSSEVVAVLWNDGLGRLTVDELPLIMGRGEAVTNTDLDGDGDLDVVIADEGDDDPFLPSSIHVIRNDGSSLGSPDRLDIPLTGAEFVASGDLDGDGHIDLAIADHGGQSEPGAVVLSFGTAGGDRVTVSHPAGTDPEALALADLDGDGDLDVASTAEGGDTVYLLLNQGDRVFAAGDRLAVGHVPQSIAAGDLDTDGDVDLVVANGAGGASILLNDGDATFAGERRVDLGENPFFVTLDDIDDDSDLDVIAANRSSADVIALVNDGTGAFRRVERFVAGPWTSVAALAPLDRDCMPDLIIGNKDGAADLVLTER